jgi:hypothetical protein
MQLLITASRSIPQRIGALQLVPAAINGCIGVAVMIDGGDEWIEQSI